MSKQCDFCGAKDKGYHKCGFYSRIINKFIKVGICDDCYNSSSEKIIFVGDDSETDSIQDGNVN